MNDYQWTDYSAVRHLEYDYVINDEMSSSADDYLRARLRGLDVANANIYAQGGAGL